MKVCLLYTSRHALDDSLIQKALTSGNTLALHQLGCHAHFQTFAFRIGHAVKQALDGSGTKLAFSDLHGGKRRNHHIAHRNVIKADDGDILRDAVAVFTQCTHCLLYTSRCV